MSLIPPSYIDSVTAIGVQNDETISWIGTGFLYGQKIESDSTEKSQFRVFLITNRHVLEHASNFVLRFNPVSSDNAVNFPINLDKDGDVPKWVPHPNPNIDIAVVPININALKEQEMKVFFFHSDKHTETRSDLKGRSASEGDPLFVLGFPMGLISNERLHVFVRSGVIARIRDLYEGRSDDFVIDAFVFPGNSGGPVISCPEPVGISGTETNSSSKLIGVIKSYIPYSDIAYSRQTNQPRVIFQENTGLTQVEPVEHIIETIKEFLSQQK